MIGVISDLFSSSSRMFCMFPGKALDAKSAGLKKEGLPYLVAKPTQLKNNVTATEQ